MADLATSRFTKLSKRPPQQQSLEGFLQRSRQVLRPPVRPTGIGTRGSAASGKDDDDDDDDIPLCPPRQGRQTQSTFKTGRGLNRGIHWSDPQAASSTVAPGRSSSVPRRWGHVVLDSDSDEEEAGESNKEPDGTADGRMSSPVAIIGHKATTQNDGRDGDDDDDDDDVQPVKRKRSIRAHLFADDDDDSGSDNMKSPPPPPSRLSSPDELSLTPPGTSRPTRRSAQAGPTTRREEQPPGSTRKNGSRILWARSARQRRMELLRRRRRGEKVTESDLDDANEGEEGGGGNESRRALYDKDPEHVALSEFEDEEKEEAEEEEEEEEGEEEGESEVDLGDAEDKPPRAAKRRRKAEEEKMIKEKEADEAQLAQIMQLSRQYDNGEDDGYDNDAEDSALDAIDKEEDMADFIDDSHVGLLGAPDVDGDEEGGKRTKKRTKKQQRMSAEDEMALLRREMPLQFTFQAHKPLLDHFKDAVEWLVHRRVNAPDPNDGDGDKGLSFVAYRDDELYRVAWVRLDNEMGGLAQSRFMSSTWTPVFRAALQARPYMDSFNLRPGRAGGGEVVLPGGELNMCHACGRTNHTAAFRVQFSGGAYDSRTLDDVEEGSEGEEVEDDDDDHVSLDMQGNALPPTSQLFYVGTVCHSNAETAHDLLHWKRALQDWVEEKLVASRVLEQVDGSAMGRQTRREFANDVVDGWETNGTIGSLFRDFARLLEGAQTKSTKTLSRYGR